MTNKRDFIYNLYQGNSCIDDTRADNDNFINNCDITSINGTLSYTVKCSSCIYTFYSLLRNGNG
jgi:hypothetical protein